MVRLTLIISTSIAMHNVYMSRMVTAIEIINSEASLIDYTRVLYISSQCEQFSVCKLAYLQACIFPACPEHVVVEALSIHNTLLSYLLSFQAASLRKISYFYHPD